MTTSAPSVRELPPRQLALLILLETLWADTGTAPSVRDLADAYEVKSLNSVVQQLRALREKGFVLLRSSASGLRADRSVLRVLRPQTWGWYRVHVQLRPRAAEGPVEQTTRDLPAPDATWALTWTATDLVKDEQWMRRYEVIALTQERISPPDEPPAGHEPPVADLTDSDDARALAAVVQGEGLPREVVDEIAGNSASAARLQSAGLVTPSRDGERLVATTKGLDGHHRARGRVTVRDLALAIDRAGGPLAQALEHGDLALSSEWGQHAPDGTPTWLNLELMSDAWDVTPARVLRRILAEVDEYPYHANLLAALTSPSETLRTAAVLDERVAVRLLGLIEHWGLARTRGEHDNATVELTALGRLLLEASSSALDDLYADLHEWTADVRR